MFRCPYCQYTNDDITYISRHVKRKHPILSGSKPLVSLYHKARHGDTESKMFYALYARRNGKYRKCKSKITLDIIEEGFEIAKQKLRI